MAANINSSHDVHLRRVSVGSQATHQAYTNPWHSDDMSSFFVSPPDMVNIIAVGMASSSVMAITNAPSFRNGVEKKV